MDKKARVALNKSIRKYRNTVRLLEENYKSKIINNGYRCVASNLIPISSKDCPLCLLYIKDNCDGCPIKEDTCEGSCYCTPYHDWVDTLYRSKTVTKKLIKAAKAELEYLEGLR